MIQSKKVLGTLGLAMKARDVVSGEFLTEKAIRSHSARLVIVAEDASDNTKRNFPIPVVITVFPMWNLEIRRC